MCITPTTGTLDMTNYQKQSQMAITYANYNSLVYMKLVNYDQLTQNICEKATRPYRSMLKLRFLSNIQSKRFYSVFIRGT